MLKSTRNILIYLVIPVFCFLYVANAGIAGANNKRDTARKMKWPREGEWRADCVKEGGFFLTDPTFQDPYSIPGDAGRTVRYAIKNIYYNPIGRLPFGRLEIRVYKKAGVKPDYSKNVTDWDSFEGQGYLVTSTSGNYKYNYIVVQPKASITLKIGEDEIAELQGQLMVNYYDPVCVAVNRLQ